MYHLANTISNDMALNLIPEVSFNPSGTLFAVCHQKANEVVVFDSHTRSVLRVYQNPDARLDNPHGILLTDKHMVVSNTHDTLRPSTFTIYNLDDPSQIPVSTYETPYQQLQEAHSLDRRHNTLVATYSENAEGPGAVVAYRYDDEAGLICGPICKRAWIFTHYGGPKGVAFSGDGSQIFITYVTETYIGGLVKYARHLKIAQQVWRYRSAAEFFRYICSKSVKIFRAMQAPSLKPNNGIAIFGISDSGVLSEAPIRILEREFVCRLENINAVGDTVLLTDTINGTIYLYDLAKDPQLESPVYTITENVTLPHGAKLSPDRTMLVVTNYGLKVSNRIIHWMTPSQNSKNSVLVYDLHHS